MFGIAGFKNSGKTTLASAIVTELTARGFKVSTIKHAHHGFDLDQQGRDSFIHRQAGAHEVAIVSGSRWAILHELREDEEPTFEEMLSHLSPCDIVIVEGFKREAYPKIEVRRLDLNHRALAPDDVNIVAIACDDPLVDQSVPVFTRNDAEKITDFILEHLGMRTP
tara:strand:+ start:185 stop:682 length:498 start_codon:yes stop_codon:yes gene_type:complete